jgi:PIN domain nuclease of toxin-antitoxin system
VLLDTCAAIWLMNGDPISAASSAPITAAQAGNPMTAWEIATLVAKNRLSLTLSPEAWFDSLLALAGVRLAAMPPRVLIASTMLPGGRQRTRSTGSSPRPGGSSVTPSSPATAI